MKTGKSRRDRAMKVPRVEERERHVGELRVSSLSGDGYLIANSYYVTLDYPKERNVR